MLVIPPAPLMCQAASVLKEDKTGDNDIIRKAADPLPINKEVL